MKTEILCVYLFLYYNNYIYIANLVKVFFTKSQNSSIVQQECIIILKKKCLLWIYNGIIIWKLPVSAI